MPKLTTILLLIVTASLPCCALSKEEPVSNGPTLSDAEFFSMLDYSLPYLSKVESPAKAGDYDAAKKELLAAMRTRRKPVGELNWWQRPEKPDPNFDRTAADNVCRHIFAGYILDTYPPYEMGPKLVWDANPYNDREWAWLLNRHYNWKILGQAYWATGDEKYAREFAAELTDWITTRPVVTDGHHNGSASWRTIEAGIRLFDSWPAVYQYFLQSPSFTPDVNALMMKSMVDHARLLIKYPTGGNWLIMECNGLVHLGTLFPEFKDSTEWRRIAMERLEKEIDRQVYPDGFQFELTTAYHMVTLVNFTGAYEIQHSNGLPLAEGYKRSLEKLYQAALYTLKPTGSLPALNDADVVLDGGSEPNGMDVLYWLRKGAELFGREDMKYVTTGGREGKAPAETSHEFPYAGLYVMRSGWDRNARYLIFDAGPFGAGHQHEDKLSIELCAYGSTLLYDCGRDTYAGTLYRHYAVSTFAHNTAVVDNQGQHRRGQKPQERKWVVTKPLSNPWSSDSRFDYASGVYDEGYGPKMDKSVTHKRQVVFVKPDYWLVLDTFTGEGEHEIETLWHFCPGTVTVDDAFKSCATSNPNKANLLILPESPEGLTVTVAEGQTDPVQGWIMPAYNTHIKAPAAVYKWKGRLPHSFAWLLYPYPGRIGKRPRIERVGQDYRITRSDGSVDNVPITPASLQDSPDALSGRSSDPAR